MLIGISIYRYSVDIDTDDTDIRKSEDREYIQWSHFSQDAKIVNIMKIEVSGKFPFLF